MMMSHLKVYLIMLGIFIVVGLAFVYLVLPLLGGNADIQPIPLKQQIGRFKI